MNPVRLLFCALLLSVAGMLSAQPLNLQPSASPVGVPEAGMPFSRYVEDTRDAVRSALAPRFAVEGNAVFTGGYSLEEAVRMRSAYEILPDAARCQGDSGERPGILLVHGLSDSPYLLRPLAESLRARFPCALLRGLLLPGHGTVPGDSIGMQHTDWQSAFRYGVNSFRGQVDQLYLLGYSTGSTLALNYLQQFPEDSLPVGMIMLSPALAARTRSAFLSPWLRYVRDWLSIEEDRDAAKYESFSVNAGAEFYLLSSQLEKGARGAVDVPVLMVVSGDDQTVSAEAARTYFCDALPAQGRRMIWYFSTQQASQPRAECEGMQRVAAADPDTRVIAYSHTAITMPPDDPHYGVDGRYSNCLHYPAGSGQREECQSADAKTVYAERHFLDDALPADSLLRRGTFNPRYQEMLEEIICFINQECSTAGE